VKEVEVNDGLFTKKVFFGTKTLERIKRWVSNPPYFARLASS
jgi:hypothetical protein